jgi:hypothetical protein
MMPFPKAALKLDQQPTTRPNNFDDGIAGRPKAFSFGRDKYQPSGSWCTQWTCIGRHMGPDRLASLRVEGVVAGTPDVADIHDVVRPRGQRCRAHVRRECLECGI